MPEHIGTLREGPLHAALKRWYAEPGDRVEHRVEGMVIDLVRGDLLIEIQTGGFAPLRRKLDRLLTNHRVRIVHPIAVDTWIMRMGEDGEVLTRRKSPKHGQVVDVFASLVYVVGHLDCSNLELDVVSTAEEQLRRHDPSKAWRRKGWVIEQRSLIDVVNVTEFRSATDLAALIPDGLDGGFTTADLADELGTSRRTAQQMAYCLRSAGAIGQTGTSGRAPVYGRI